MARSKQKPNRQNASAAKPGTAGSVVSAGGGTGAATHSPKDDSKVLEKRATSDTGPVAGERTSVGVPASSSSVLPADLDGESVDYVAPDASQSSDAAGRQVTPVHSLDKRVSSVELHIKAIFSVAAFLAVSIVGGLGWVMTISGEVGKYREKVDSHTGDIAKKDQDIRRLEDRLNGIDGRLSRIEGRLQALESRLRSDAGVAEDAPSLAQSWGVVEQLRYRGNIGVKITAAEGEYYFYFHGDQLVAGRPYWQLPPADSAVSTADFLPVRRFSRLGGERVLAIHRGRRVMCYALRPPRLIFVECESMPSVQANHDAGAD